MIKNSAKRDTRPLKGRDLTHKCSLRGNPKRSFSRKIWSVWRKKLGWGVKFFKGSGLSVAPKPECGITQSSSRIALYTVLTVLAIMDLTIVNKKCPWTTLELPPRQTQRKKILQGGIILEDWGSSVALKSECGITQPFSIITCDNILTSLRS